MPLTGRRPYTRELRIREFWAKVEKTATCWLWRGSLSHAGYGRYWWDGRMQMAHRVSLELFGRKVPNHLQADHLCRVRACIRPSHLDPVTCLENVRRTPSANKTHCKNGHKYDENNTYRYKGSRKCRACSNEAMKTKYRNNARKYRLWQRRYRKTAKYRASFVAWYSKKKGVSR